MVAHDTDLSARPIGHRTVFRLAWPILVSMLSYTAMTVADSLFVAQLGTAPLAAVGLAATGAYLLNAFPIGLMGGARVQIAQSTGAGEHRRATALACQAIGLALALGLAVAALLPLAGAYLALLGAGPAIVEHGTPYLQVRIASAPLVFGMFALQAWYQGRGDTRTPMVAVLVANALNIALDPVFIFGWFGIPALGVSGAAIATAIALAAQNLVLWVPAVGPLLAQPTGLRRGLVARIWRTGLPMGTNYALDVLSYVVFSALLASVGDAHLAAHVIVVRILMVSFLPGHAIGEAAGVLVGQAIGAHRPDQARRAWWAATQQAVGGMALCGLAFLLVPDVLVAAFRAEPDVARIAVQVLALGALIQVFDAVAMVAFGSLNGAGDTRFTMVCNLAVNWVAKVPVCAFGVLVLEWGAFGAWLGIAAEVVLIAFVGVLRIRGSAWLAHGDAVDETPGLSADAEPAAA
jgi:MATE family multidrug resistance protein